MAQENEQQKPKIIVDDDWKAQARAEKEKLASQSPPKAGPASPAGTAGGAARQAGPRSLPPASISTLVSSIASQALFVLGAIPDPSSQRRYVDLDLAKHHIDTLKVLEEKTRGNLTQEEKDLLDRTLYELRSAYVQLSQRVAGL